MERLATSDFTLNFNPGARGNDKAPTLKGKAKVIDSDGIAHRDVEVRLQGARGERGVLGREGHVVEIRSLALRLVGTPGGDLELGRRAVDMSAWHRPKHSFYFGNALLHDRAAAAAARVARLAAEPR